MFLEESKFLVQQYYILFKTEHCAYLGIHKTKNPLEFTCTPVNTAVGYENLFTSQTKMKFLAWYHEIVLSF
jgi:hypothetical protein